MFTRLTRWLSSRKSRTLNARPQARRTRPQVELVKDRLAPAILNVNTLADGINHTDSNLALREALEAVNAGSTAGFTIGERDKITGTLGSADEIRFDPSLSGGAIFLIGTQLTIGRSVSITGPGGDGLTLFGNNSSRIFFIADGNSASQQVVGISGLFLTAGNTTTTGGAILNQENLTLTGCTFIGNSANGTGGAIQNEGSLTVVNSTFNGNSSPGDNGGAIHTTGSLTVTGSTFTGNTAVLSGGALSVSGSASARLINSTVSGNSAAANGGALNVNNSASLLVTNSTLVLNRADFDGTGNGVSGAISRFGSATVTLNNTIVAGNVRGSGAGSSDDLSTTVAAASSNNLIGDPNSAGGLTEGVNGNLVGNGTGGLLPLASILNATLVNNGGTTQTHALVLNSRALNAGSNTLALDANNAALTTDQRGAARQLGSTVDIGAVEYQGPNQAPVNTVPLTKLKLKKNRLFTFNGLLSVADADAGAGALQLSLAITKGKLILTSANNVTIVGSNTKLMTLTGTVSAVNAALAALQYKPSSTHIGGVKLTMTTSDQGNTGNPLTDVDVVRLGLS